ncbi:MAG: alpha/beta fold hydrolase [Gammaproteobacteria bacterium]|nr:alpha/beta fold hydrolase [Gammaproteobacteria bacterium]
MGRLELILVGLIAIIGGQACSPGNTPKAVSAIELESCRLYGGSGMTSVAAQCGRLPVAEDPSAPEGRQIELFVARIAALNSRVPRSAFTLLAGGPGQAASEVYADYAPLFARIQRYHDIILIDQRGTGNSARLDCPFDESDTLDFDAASAARQAAECLQQLEGDPRFYSTSVAVKDLDLARKALGYEQLDIYAASYGTRVAQHYLRRYPDRVRTMVIDGVVPAELRLGPDIAIDAQIALEKLFARCREDETCNDRFPDIERSFNDLRNQLRAAPVDLMLAAPTSGEQISMSFDYTAFAGAVRLLSYTPDTAALLPLLLDEAANNDNWSPLAAQAQIVMESIADALSEGMHNAVMCAEDVPYYDIDEQKRTALRATYLGQLQVESLQAICAIWPTGLMDADFHQPVESAVPVLLLSGSADPITPPRYADIVAQHLSNSRHIVADGHGHGVLTRSCVAGLIADFVDSASVRDIDATCVDKQKPAPFFTRFSGPEP